MYTVLYVDDEPDDLELGRIFLERDGQLRVETRSSAAAGLEALRERPYDAIVSDYQMPGMDGISFLRAVRSEFGDIPFLLFTGRGREEVAIAAINNGADRYLQKGGDPGVRYTDSPTGSVRPSCAGRRRRPCGAARSSSGASWTTRRTWSTG